MASNISHGGRGRGRGKGSRPAAPAPGQSKGRSSGVPNYQTNILLNIIEAVMPVGSLMWQTVVAKIGDPSKSTGGYRDPRLDFFA